MDVFSAEKSGVLSDFVLEVYFLLPARDVWERCPFSCSLLTPMLDVGRR